MDLNDYWQENKKFLMTVFAGAVVLLIGYVMIESFLGDKVDAANRRITRAKRELKNEMYTSQDLADARAENEALLAAMDTLRGSVAFDARDRFRLRKDGGRPGGQFFSILSSVRDDLLQRAQRQGARIPEDLGMPGLSPTHEDELERTLEALDVIDRSIRLALDAGIQRIDELSIKLDPRLGSRDGGGAIEETRIKFVASSGAAPLMRFLSSTQSDQFGQPLLIEEFEITPARRKTDEARLETTFIVARLSEEG